MESLRPAPPFDLNSDENREARALFSTTTQASIAQAGGSTSTFTDRSSGTARPYTSSSRTSTHSTATAAPTKSVWEDVFNSSSEDEKGRPASSSAPIDVDVAAGNDNNGNDSDADMNKVLASITAAAVPSPSTHHSKTLGSPPPLPASTNDGPAQANGANGVNGGGSSPTGSTGKKRRREGKDDDAASADREPPPPRRTCFDSDSDNDGDDSAGDEDRLRVGKATAGRRRSKALSSRHRNDGRSPRRSSSPGEDGRSSDGGVRSGPDPGYELGVRGCGGRGTAVARRPKKGGISIGIGQRHEGGTDRVQVGFDSDSDSSFGGGAAGAEKRGGGQEAVMEEEEEEEYDGDGEGLKPTLRHAPFNDTEMRPLVLTNEAGGQRAEVPASVNRYLKDYQREGVEFMYRRVRHAEGPKGVILADDMGLGKTVQTVSLLLALLKKKGTGQDLKDLHARRKRNEHASAAGKPVLIVCPRTVLPSWEKHLAEWGHFASRSILTGGSSTGRVSLQGVENLLDAGRLEVVVVGETMFSNSVDTLAKLDWLAVVFDEVHHFKNPQTRKAKAVEKMEKADVLVGLTGTLVQNELDELWTVMNMIAPGCLGERDDFKQHFTGPYLRGRKRGASRSDCLIATERLKELFVLRDKVVLRREKSILGDLLKGKIGTVVFCDLTEVQKLIYRTVLDLPEFRLLATANEPCPCGRVGEKRGSCCGVYPKDDSSEDGVDPKAVIWRRFHPNLELCDKRPGCPYCCAFSAISKLQKLANHPCLLQVKPIRDYEGQHEKRLHDIAFAQVAFSEQALAIMTTRPGEHDGAVASAGGGSSSGGGGAVGGGDHWDRRLARPENFLQLCRDDTCGKMKTLKVLLERFKNKDKVLLFSYSTAMLDILQMLCSSEGYTFLRLDGNTAKDQRPKMIQRFAEEDAFGSNIFLISTKAGGTGLNLQSANKVILYDVNWNPAQDAQAEDRAYRIGQLRDVEVFRLVSTGTIEELTYMRQIYKLQTSAATMGDKSAVGVRQFEGVQGDSSQQGELWGISNLMNFSGESMLMKLRQEHGAGLPPLVPDTEDGLVMEPAENIVSIVNNYAAAENSSSTNTAATEAQDIQDFPAGGGEEEEEEEFDDLGWGAGGGGGGAAGAEALNKDAELGGVVMLHDEMVAADKEEELPLGTQESININEVEIMDHDDTDDESMDESMDDAMDGGGGAAAAAAAAGDAAVPAGASASNTVSQEPGIDEGGAGVGHLAAAAAAAAAAVAVAAVAAPATIGHGDGHGLAAGAGLGGHGGAGAAGTASRVVTQALDDADVHDHGGGDGGLAGGQGHVEGGEGEPSQAEDEPSWALAPTQEPGHESVHVHGVPSSTPVSPSSPSPSGNGDGDGDGVPSQVESGAEAAAAARSRGGGVSMSSQHFIYAPAAQDVLGLGILDYIDGGEEKEAREEEEEESKAAEGHVGIGGAIGAEETHEGDHSNSAGSSLDLEIPYSNCEGGSNEVGPVAGGLEQPGAAANGPDDGDDGNDPHDPVGTPEQEESSSELELALSNSEDQDVSFSSGTQPPTGFV